MKRLSMVAVLAPLALPITPLNAQTSPSAYTSGTRYDLAGHVTGTISADPDGVGTGNPFLAVRNTYDAAGRLTTVETGALSGWQSEAIAPASWTGFSPQRTAETSYDSMGRKTLETVRDGGAGTVRAATQYSYDLAGRLECTAVRMNPALFGSLPTSACTLGTAGSDGPDRITRNVYDARGQLLQIREGVGTADEGTEATFDYSPNGRRTAVIDGNGNRAEMTYDGLDRQTRWSFPSGTPPGSRPTPFDDSTPATALATAGSVNASDYEEYGYDPNGNRTSLRKRDGASMAYTSGNTLTYTYDALNRVTVKTVPERSDLSATQTRDVYYSYDLRGLQLSARFDSQSGEGITNSYDGFGRLASSSTSMGGTTRTLTNAYDANGNRTRITHPDGVYFTYDYDGLGRPTWLSEPSAIVYHIYEPSGVFAGFSRVGGVSGFIHSPDGALTGLSHYRGPSATIDLIVSLIRNPAGQIVSRSADNDAYSWTGHYAVNRPYATNGLNQYMAAGTTSFGYDANGNLISDGSRAYLYDVENRLVASSTGASLIYDPLGRLFQTWSPTTTVTRFLYDGDAIVAEYDGVGAMQHRYVHDLGADTPLVQYDGATVGDASRHYLLSDERGSIVAVTDGISIILAHDTYDEYGIPGANNQGRFQYTGQAWLPELGMYYYKARIYSPTLGRFMQTDPIGYADQFNLYAYVGNDPVNRMDPTGLYKCEQGADCGKFESYRQNLIAARDSYRTGSADYRMLDASLRVIGEPGGRGAEEITIHEGGENPTNSSVSATMDGTTRTMTIYTPTLEKAARMAGNDPARAGATIIAHEAAPDHMRPMSNRADRLSNEVAGFRAQEVAARALGVHDYTQSSPAIDRLYGADLETRLLNNARGSVIAACVNSNDPTCR